MNTIRLFKENVYLKEAPAKITGAESIDGKTLITLSQTLFFPTGGGQSCDKGTINGYQVSEVYEKDGEIYHIIDCPEGALETGAEAALVLDWNHRFDNMQRHCGEHILSGIFHREYGGVNRGFHMGDQYMTIDISLEDNPDYTQMTWEMARRAELCANEVIWSDAPVITRHFDTREEAAKLPLRKALALDEDITIVCVGSVENPSDCVACCGTHPQTAGQVGLIKIYKVESNKGMFRIYFEAGARALAKYQHEFDTLTELGNKLSAGTEDILAKYNSQQEKNKEVRSQLYLLKKQVLEKEVEDISAELKTSGGSDTAAATHCPVRRYDILSIDDLMSMTKELIPLIPKLLFLVHKPSHTVLLVSGGKINCGNLVKENAGIYNGKGGGSPTTARAIFTKDEYIDTFIDLIEKHLR